MNVWSLERLLAAWAAMSVLSSVSSYEVTVRFEELMLCKGDRRVCVTHLRDCESPPPSSVQKNLNMSCYCQKEDKTMTCVWSQESTEQSDVSLIISRSHNIISCRGLFIGKPVVNVTARIRDVTEGEIWSQPLPVDLYRVVKPSQPVLTVLDSAEDSLDVSWRSSSDGSCNLRYRLSNSSEWTQAPDVVPVLKEQMRIYTIRDLLPCSIYRVAVACSSNFGFQSDWSSDVSGKTQARAPSKPPDVCYRVEKPENTSGRSVRLHLIWKPPEERCPILGYQVSKEPGGYVRNVTERTATLVAEEGNCSVAVTAFTTAGSGPSAHLRIDTKRQNTLPRVRGVWVSRFHPDEKALLVQWEAPLVTSPSALPGSNFVIQLHSETNPSFRRWVEVSGSVTAVIQVQGVDPDESFLISVFPVSKQQCGRSLSLSASLQHGALMEATELKIISVTKTAVMVECVWLNKSRPVKVNGYQAKLRTNSDTGHGPTVFLWPHQRQHTFFNLTPNTEYSVLLLADNASIATVPVRTESDELPAVTTVTPLLLLTVTVLMISVLSRTVYKSYFVPHISSPRGSTTGQWLMNTNLQKSTEKRILDIKDFQVTDVLGEKSLIVVSPDSRLSFEEGLHEDSSLLSPGRVTVKLSMLKLDTDCVCDDTQSSEYQPVQMHEANCWFPQDKGENEISSHEIDAIVKRHLDELLADSRCGHQMTCESEYLVNSPIVEKTEVEKVSRQSDCSHMICDAGYIDNSCFTPKPADKY